MYKEFFCYTLEVAALYWRSAVGKNKSMNAAAECSFAVGLFRKSDTHPLKTPRTRLSMKNDPRIIKGKK